MHATNYGTQKKRNQIVKEYLSAQLTRKEFCKQKGISLSSLYRWKTEYQETQTEPLHFLPLVKQKNGVALTQDEQIPFKGNGFSGEIRIEIGVFNFFIQEQSSLPLLRSLLEEVRHLAF